MLTQNNWLIYKTSSEMKLIKNYFSVTNFPLLCDKQRNCNECGEGWSMFLRKVRIL